MATWQHELIDPPTESRARELWLQHAAGFIVFEDARRYAMERIDPRSRNGEPVAATSPRSAGSGWRRQRSMG